MTEPQVTNHCPECESLQHRIDALIEMRDEQEEQIRSYQARIERLVQSLSNRGAHAKALACKYGLEMQETPQTMIDMEDGKREDAEP